MDANEAWEQFKKAVAAERQGPSVSEKLDVLSAQALQTSTQLEEMEKKLDEIAAPTGDDQSAGQLPIPGQEMAMGGMGGGMPGGGAPAAGATPDMMAQMMGGGAPSEGGEEEQQPPRGAAQTGSQIAGASFQASASKKMLRSKTAIAKDSCEKGVVGMGSGTEVNSTFEKIKSLAGNNVELLEQIAALEKQVKGGDSGNEAANEANTAAFTASASPISKKMLRAPVGKSIAKGGVFSNIKIPKTPSKKPGTYSLPNTDAPVQDRLDRSMLMPLLFYQKDKSKMPKRPKQTGDEAVGEAAFIEYFKKLKEWEASEKEQEHKFYNDLTPDAESITGVMHRIHKVLSMLGKDDFYNDIVSRRNEFKEWAKANPTSRLYNDDGTPAFKGLSDQGMVSLAKQIGQVVARALDNLDIARRGRSLSSTERSVLALKHKNDGYGAAVDYALNTGRNGMGNRTKIAGLDNLISLMGDFNFDGLQSTMPESPKFENVNNLTIDRLKGESDEDYNVRLAAVRKEAAERNRKAYVNWQEKLKEQGVKTRPISGATSRELALYNRSMQAAKAKAVLEMLNNNMLFKNLKDENGRLLNYDLSTILNDPVALSNFMNRMLTGSSWSSMYSTLAPDLITPPENKEVPQRSTEAEKDNPGESEQKTNAALELIQSLDDDPLQVLTMDLSGTEKELEAAYQELENEAKRENIHYYNPQDSIEYWINYYTDPANVPDPEEDKESYQNFEAQKKKLFETLSNELGPVINQARATALQAQNELEHGGVGPEDTTVIGNITDQSPEFLDKLGLSDLKVDSPYYAQAETSAREYLKKKYREAQAKTALLQYAAELKAAGDDEEKKAAIKSPLEQGFTLGDYGFEVKGIRRKQDYNWPTIEDYFNLPPLLQKEADNALKAEGLRYTDLLTYPEALAKRAAGGDKTLSRLMTEGRFTRTNPKRNAIGTTQSEAKGITPEIKNVVLDYIRELTGVPYKSQNTEMDPDLATKVAHLSRLADNPLLPEEDRARLKKEAAELTVGLFNDLLPTTSKTKEKRQNIAEGRRVGINKQLAQKILNDPSLVNKFLQEIPGKLTEALGPGLKGRLYGRPVDTFDQYTPEELRSSTTDPVAVRYKQVGNALNRDLAREWLTVPDIIEPGYLGGSMPPEENMEKDWDKKLFQLIQGNVPKTGIPESLVSAWAGASDPLRKTGAYIRHALRQGHNTEHYSEQERDKEKEDILDIEDAMESLFYAYVYAGKNPSLAMNQAMRDTVTAVHHYSKDGNPIDVQDVWDDLNDRVDSLVGKKNEDLDEELDNRQKEAHGITEQQGLAKKLVRTFVKLRDLDKAYSDRINYMISRSDLESGWDPESGAWSGADLGYDPEFESANGDEISSKAERLANLTNTGYRLIQEYNTKNSGANKIPGEITTTMPGDRVLQVLSDGLGDLKIFPKRGSNTMLTAKEYIYGRPQSSDNSSDKTPDTSEAKSEEGHTDSDTSPNKSNGTGSTPPDN